MKRPQIKRLKGDERYANHLRRLWFIVAFGSMGVAFLVLSSATRPDQWSTPRDVATWPFSQNSIWNMPIGSGAQYVQFYGVQASDASGNPIYRSSPGIQNPGIYSDDGYKTVRSGYGVNTGIDTDYDFFTSSSDPVRTVYTQTTSSSGRCNGTGYATNADGTPKYTTYLNDNSIIPDFTGTGPGPNSSAAIVQPDGSIKQYNYAARCTAGADDFHGTPASAFNKVDSSVVKADQNIYSTGIYGGHGGSGMSALGGTLTPDDFTNDQPIHHALSMDVNGAEYLYYDHTANIGYVWPAATNDGAAYLYNYYGGYRGGTPALRMGSLLAVPASVTSDSIGLTPPSSSDTDPNAQNAYEAALKIFQAMQDYGVYIVDDTGWSSVDLNIRQDTNAAFEAKYGFSIGPGNPRAPWWHPPNSDLDFYNNLMKIYGSLQVVANNGPNSIGGGGTPRRPLAPAFHQALQGDLNNDSHVNIFDLSIFLSHWQEEGTGLIGDFNNDGVVNIFDLSILLNNYGQ